MTREEIQQQLNGIKDTRMSMYSDKQMDHMRSKYKTIYQYDLDGNYLRTFESATQVCNHLKCHKQGWSAWFNDFKNGKQNNIKGYLWSYDKVDKLVLPKKYRYIIYDMEGKEVTRVFNLTEFSRSLGYKSVMSLKNLQQYLRNKYVIKKV